MRLLPPSIINAYKRMDSKTWETEEHAEAESQEKLLQKVTLSSADQSWHPTSEEERTCVQCVPVELISLTLTDEDISE